MNKSEKLSDHLQEQALFAKAISHPTPLSIFMYLIEIVDSYFLADQNNGYQLFSN